MAADYFNPTESGAVLAATDRVFAGRRWITSSVFGAPRGVTGNVFGAPRGVTGSVFGTPRGTTGRGGHLILGYQKSVSAPADCPASCWTGGRFSRQVHSRFSPTSANASVASVAANANRANEFMFSGAANAISASAVAGFGGQRFLVPQYEAAAKDCRCAGLATKHL